MMDYSKSAEELLEYLIITERLNGLIQGNVAEIAKGELAVLTYLIEEKNGASAIDISHKFRINTSRVAAILKALMRKELIERKADPRDKRKIQVYFTEKGYDYVQYKRKDILKHITKMLEILGEEDAKEHIRLVKRIVDISSNIECK